MRVVWKPTRGRKVRLVADDVLEVGIVRMTDEEILVRPYPQAIVADVAAFEAVVGAVLHGRLEDYEWVADERGLWRHVTVSADERGGAQGSDALQITVCEVDLCTGFGWCHPHEPQAEPMHTWNNLDADDDPRWATNVIRVGDGPWSAHLRLSSPVAGEDLELMLSAVLWAKAGARQLNQEGRA